MVHEKDFSNTTDITDLAEDFNLIDSSLQPEGAKFDYANMYTTTEHNALRWAEEVLFVALQQKMRQRHFVVSKKNIGN